MSTSGSPPPLALKRSSAPYSDAGVTRLVATVHGRVQGVAFRYFAQTRARRLGVSGYARNRSDGHSVKVCGEGSQAALDAWLQQLRIGPPSARVVRVDVSWAEATGEFTGFTIRP